MMLPRFSLPPRLQPANEHHPLFYLAEDGSIKQVRQRWYVKVEGFQTEMEVLPYEVLH